MGRKHAHTVRKAAASPTSSAEQRKEQQLQNLPRPQNNDAEVLSFLSSSLAAWAASGLQTELARLVDALRLGAFTALCTNECGRLAMTTRVVRALLDAMTAERVVSALRGTCLICDAGSPREKPLLTMSHLESLAHSHLLFGAARELFSSINAGKQQHSAVLLEISGTEDELCEALVKLAFSEAAEDEQRNASATAHMAALLFQFRSPREQWSTMLLRALGRRMAGVGRIKASAGGVLEMFLNGTGKLLPTTRTGCSAAKGVAEGAIAAALCCQLLERLVFPTAQSVLTLRISCLSRPMQSNETMNKEFASCSSGAEGDAMAMSASSTQGNIAGEGRNPPDALDATADAEAEAQADVETSESSGSDSNGKADEDTVIDFRVVSWAEDAPCGVASVTENVGSLGAASVQGKRKESVRVTARAKAAAEAAAEAAATQASQQSAEFLQTLRSLEEEALPRSSKPFDLWVLEGSGHHYALFLE